MKSTDQHNLRAALGWAALCTAIASALALFALGLVLAFDFVATDIVAFLLAIVALSALPTIGECLAEANRLRRAISADTDVRSS